MYWYDKISAYEFLTELMHNSQSFRYNVTILSLMKKSCMIFIILTRIQKPSRNFFVQNIHFGIALHSFKKWQIFLWSVKYSFFKIMSSAREILQVWEENNEFSLIPRKLVAQSWRRPNGWTGRFGPKHKS